MAGEGFRDRLRRLRRDERIESPPEGLPDSLKRRLERSVAGESAQQEQPITSRENAQLGDPVRLEERESAAGVVLARRQEFERGYLHGALALEEIEAARCSDFALFTDDAALGELELSKAVYLDTETTGLSGGAGTYVFLVGLGRFEGDSFELWQGFMRDPGDERALLADCAERIAASSGVVSFFGKSFDRHRLEDKMRLHGIEAPFDSLPHLDLYHPLRRLYRGAYADGKLRTMERELCGVEREDDLPGSFAPAAWFDYLAGRPHLLEGVFEHNSQDVLSLVTLAAHLGRSSEGERANGESLSGDGCSRAYGIARSLIGQRRRDEALAYLERNVFAEDSTIGSTRQLAVLRAELVEKSGDRERALELWRALAAQPEDAHSPHCLARMARLLERDGHKAQALECSRVARALLERYAKDARSRRCLAELDGIERRAAREAGETEG